MRAEFTVDGRTVRAPVPQAWAADVADGRLRLARDAGDGLPHPLIELAFRPATDLRAALDEELEDLVVRLTDFTILHVEARALRPENWRGTPAPTPFVFAGYRQGIFSMLLEVGLAGSDGAQAAVAFSLCLLEDAAALQPEVDAILDGIEVDWP